ncbi:MAG: hypothetical protein ACM3X6_12535 [Patescibacteria group bacterium]
MPKRKKEKAADYEYLGRPAAPARPDTEIAAETNPRPGKQEAKAKPKGRC